METDPSKVIENLVQDMAASEEEPKVIRNMLHRCVDESCDSLEADLGLTD
jgi:hypothetical protein